MVRCQDRRGAVSPASAVASNANVAIPAPRGSRIALGQAEAPPVHSADAIGTNLSVPDQARPLLPQILISPPPDSSSPEAIPQHPVARISHESPGSATFRPSLGTIGYGGGHSGLDHLRILGESDYYDHVDEQGRSRRRSMMKEVSSRDYLRGRGANPRTGLVTPSVLSRNTSIDETNIAEVARAAIGTKWRQKGDQWVSVDDTDDAWLRNAPTTSTVSINESEAGMPRLGDDFMQPRGDTTPRRHDDNQEHVEILAHVDTHKVDRGTVVYRPTEQLSDAGQLDLPSLKRKPVAQPQEPKWSNPSTRDPTLKPLPLRVQNQSVEASRARSSSAPTPRKSSQARPDTGKKLPPLPTQSADQRVSPSKATATNVAGPFLGPPLSSPELRSQNQKNGQNPQMKPMDRRSPDLPMRSGQLQQRHQTATYRANGVYPGQRMNQKVHRRLDQQIRGYPSTWAYQRHRPMPIRNIQFQSPERDQWWPHKTGSGLIDAIPFYDNPPRNLMYPQPRAKVVGQQQKPLLNGQVAKNTVYRQATEDPFITIPTITGISTITSPGTVQIPTSLSQPCLPVDRSGARPMKLPINSPPEVLKSLSIDTTPSIHTPIPKQGKPREGFPHTQPPLLAATSSNLSKYDKLTKIPDMTHTENRTPSNMTSTQPTMSNVQNGKAQRLLADEIQVLTNFQTRAPNPYAIRDLLTERPRETEGGLHPKLMDSGLTRKCSHCHRDFTAGGLNQLNLAKWLPVPRKVSPSSNAPEPISSLETIDHTVPSVSAVLNCEARSQSSDSISNTHSTFVNSVDFADGSDHSICCVDCCNAGFHASCLGHLNLASVDECDYAGLRTPLAHHIAGDNDTSSSTSRDVIHTAAKRRRAKLPYLAFDLKASFGRGSQTSSHSSQVDPKAHSQHDNKENGQGSLISSAGNVSATTVDHSIRSASFGAVSAARKAIETLSSPGSPRDQQRSELKIRKTRLKNSGSKETSTLGTSVGQSPATNQRAPTKAISLETQKLSTECGGNARKDWEYRKTTPLTGWTKVTSKKKHSKSTGSSTSTTPCVKTNIVDDLCDVIIMPFAAAHMWIRNNPQVLEASKPILAQCWKIFLDLLASIGKFLKVMFVYSKTGAIHLDQDTSPVELVKAGLRNTLLILVLVSIVAIVVRILRTIFLPVQIVIWIIGTAVTGGSKIARTIL